MPEKIIQQLIDGEYLYQGQAVHVPLKSVVIDTKLAKNAGDLLSRCGLRGRGLIVSDTNTHSVLGAEIEAALGGDAIPFVFGSGVKADILNVEKIKSAASACEYIIAVGSGTINDLCKYASFLINKPYAVFGTAPSMNGYGSANASITVAGHKKTLKAHMPRGIFLDLGVLVKTPLRLIRSGLGDSLCRPTAQADWLLSHVVLGTFYTDLPFIILKDVEADLFANSKALVNGDIEIMRMLAITLVLSGFGMYLAGGSYPSSQGEHMIAHTIEMAYGDSMPHSYHGEQIGITTLTMARLQESMLQGNIFILKESFVPESIPELLGLEVAQECISEYKAKQFSKDELDSINNSMQDNWDNISERISSVILPYNLLSKTLSDAGCAMFPADIGWPEIYYNNAIGFAKFSRGRFTFLDLK